MHIACAAHRGSIPKALRHLGNGCRHSRFGLCDIFRVASFMQGLRAQETKLKKAGKSLIILWMGGGPSHMDLWDLKPDAPAEFRGEFTLT